MIGRYFGAPYVIFLSKQTSSIKLVCLFKMLGTSVVMLVCLVARVLGLFHVYLDQGGRKCFQKEIEKEQLLIGRYSIQIREQETHFFYLPRDIVNTGVVIDVEEVFLGNRVVHRKANAKGQFAFSALATGEYRICLTPKSFYTRKWLRNDSPEEELAKRDLRFVQARLQVDIEVGDGLLVDTKPDKKKVDHLVERILQLSQKLVDIRREQRFIRQKEWSFRDQSELTCSRVLKWTWIQVGVLLMTGVWYLFSLARFFNKAKIA